MGFVFIIAGCVGVILGIVGDNFTAADPDATTSFNRKVSKRSGRTVFILAGAILIVAGIKFLVSLQ
jgi:hypothetical protein